MIIPEFNQVSYGKKEFKNFSQGVSQALLDDVYVIFPTHVNFPMRSSCVNLYS